jgi:folylpolyglutamate synthase/dihydropteroate synthase
MSLDTLTQLFKKHEIQVYAHATLAVAMDRVKKKLQHEDQCIITGSFHTVGEVKNHE